MNQKDVKVILLIEADDARRRMYLPILENIFINSIILEATTCEHALARMEEIGSIDVVISGYQINGVSTKTIVQNAIENKSVKKYIFHSEKLNEMPDWLKELKTEMQFLFLKYPANAREFKLFLAQNFDGNYAANEFAKIHIAYFWRFSRCICDIYLRLSDEKYVRIIKAYDEYTRDEINRYDKGEHYFYIKTNEIEGFSQKLFNPGRDIFLMSDKANLEETIKTGHAIIQHLALSVGISNDAIELAEIIVEQTLVGLKNNQDLAARFLKVRDKSDYIYDHSLLLSMLTCQMAMSMLWNNQETMRKLVLASLFHDISLDDAKIAMIHDMDSALYLVLNDDDKKKFRDHPVVCADMINKNVSMPPDVATIVLCHHEKFDGTGFPRKLSATRIIPLAQIFILAHDFLTRLYYINFNPEQIQEELASMKDYYKESPDFFDILEKFAQTLQKN